MDKKHSYSIVTKWTGNRGTGTNRYDAYSRAHEISVAGKPVIPCSSDPKFRGERDRYNPEEMLVAALSGCHMLWFLHLSAVSGIVVSTYEDAASGTMIETEDGGGHFAEGILRPRTTLQPGADLDLAKQLHDRAHHLCFIANSVNFPVRCEPIFD